MFLIAYALPQVLTRAEVSRLGACKADKPHIEWLGQVWRGADVDEGTQFCRYLCRHGDIPVGFSGVVVCPQDAALRCKSMGYPCDWRAADLGMYFVTSALLLHH